MNATNTLTLRLQTNLPQLQQMLDQVNTLMDAIQNFKIEVISVDEPDAATTPLASGGITPQTKWRSIARAKADGHKMDIVDIPEGESVKVDFSGNRNKVLRIRGTLLFVYYDDGGYFHTSIMDPDKYDILEALIL